MHPRPRDVAQIRLDNALALFDEFVRSTVKDPDLATLRGLERRFAERLQIQPSYWSQIKSRSRQSAPAAWNVVLLHHLHSGEQFGPAGVIVSILSGLSLFFFAVSGLWMYVQLWRGRLVRSGDRKLYW